MHLAVFHLRLWGDNLKISSDWQQREEYLVTLKAIGRVRGELWGQKERAAAKKTCNKHVKKEKKMGKF